MKKKHLLPFLLLLSLPLVLSSCDGKRPDGGFISDDEVTKIVTNFESEAIYGTYHVKGTLNFFGNPKNEDSGTENINGSIDFDDFFDDSLDKYDKNKSASYYLAVPLHITLTNWKSEVMKNDIPQSTKYQLEAKMYRVAGLDKVYYYANEQGGITAKSFGVNKDLVIYDDYQEMHARAKWNVEVVYDGQGYLVKESFATLNANSSNPKDYVKGEATYTFA